MKKSMPIKRKVLGKKGKKYKGIPSKKKGGKKRKKGKKACLHDSDKKQVNLSASLRGEGGRARDLGKGERKKKKKSKCKFDKKKKTLRAEKAYDAGKRWNQIYNHSGGGKSHGQPAYRGGKESKNAPPLQGKKKKKNQTKLMK